MRAFPAALSDYVEDAHQEGSPMEFVLILRHSDEVGDVTGQSANIEKETSKSNVEVV